MQTVNQQVIAQGPTASQEIIKELGTNGGGFFNANSAHPFENPTPFTNFLEMFCILAIPSALYLHAGKDDGLAAAWMGGVGGDGVAFPGRSDDRVLGRSAGQSVTNGCGAAQLRSIHRLRRKPRATLKGKKCASAWRTRRCSLR